MNDKPKKSRRRAPPRSNGKGRGRGSVTKLERLRRLAAIEDLMTRGLTEQRVVAVACAKFGVVPVTVQRWIAEIHKGWEAESQQNLTLRERHRVVCARRYEDIFQRAMSLQKRVTYRNEEGERVSAMQDSPDLMAARGAVDGLARIYGLNSIDVNVGASSNLVALLRSSARVEMEPIDIDAEVPEPLPLASGDD